jgi:hypothetical protein
MKIYKKNRFFNEGETTKINYEEKSMAALKNIRCWRDV